MEAIVRTFTPDRLSDLWVVVFTQALAAMTLVIGFHAASWALLRVCNVITRETEESEVKWHVISYVLKPLAIAMPYLGWLVGFMRLLSGLDSVSAFSRSSPQSPAWLWPTLQQVMSVTEPLCSFLAKAIVAVTLGSLSYTILLIKNRLFETKLNDFVQNMEPDHAEDVTRMVVPFNSLATWIITGLSIVTILITFGYNPQPLLALGSVSGIVVGFASQEILLNLFSGINLFITRPFVVGDMVDIRSQPVGMSLAKGIVVKIEPLRTIMLTEGDKLTTIPNRTVTDSLITNFSTFNTSKKASAAPLRTYYLTSSFKLEPPADRKQYTDHARRAIQAVLVRLSILPGLEKETIKGHVSSYEEGRYVINFNAIGVTDEFTPFDYLNQAFIFSCHDAMASFGGTAE